MNSTLLLEATEPKAVVEVEIKGVYGRELIYPVNSLAHAFANLLGQRTFTQEQIRLIEKLGAKIEIKKPWEKNDGQKTGQLKSHGFRHD